MRNFKIWIEQDGDMTPNLGADTPASGEVKRTNMQPQVDAHEVNPKINIEQDKILAIDQMIERFDLELPDSSSPRVNKFLELWKNLREKWDEIKTSEHFNGGSQEDGIEGLGTSMGNKKYLDMMSKHKNAIPVTPQAPPGPGTFGQM